MPGINLLNSIKLQRPKSNKFDLSHDVKMSLSMGTLCPTMLLECSPGDKFQLGCDSLIRMLPMVAPLMHRVDVTMHYFFVPLRLLWPNWQTYITTTLLGGAPPAHPFITLGTAIGGAGNTKLTDYFGIPPVGVAGNTNAEKINALPFSAYQLIWNEYYRDQNLQTAVNFACTDGDNSANTALLALQNRAWEHDYFTASLPFAQRGSAVNIPIGNVIANPVTGNQPILHLTSGAALPSQTALTSDASAHLTSTPGGGAGVTIDPNGAWSVAGTFINDLRKAFKLQEWLEKAARGGNRYIENLLVHFGVKSSDSRLQRPEYIVGTKAPIMISEVLNMTGTATAAQGTMAGHGLSAQQGRYGKYFCEEHGYIIGLINIAPKTAYYQGIPKVFLKTTDGFDHFWPSFAHLGEQAVLNREIYAYQATAAQNGTFGYVPRYTEYKYMPNRVAGDMRSTLDFWHMGRKFAGAPALNSTFISQDPTTRIFAVTTGDTMVAQVLHKIIARRGMPKFGTPSF